MSTAETNTAADNQLRTAIEAAIAQVDDPCSIAAKAAMSVSDMGLVREWHIDDGGVVVVTISPTAPSCILMSSIADGIESRVAAVEGVEGIRVEVDTVTMWTPDLMTESGRRTLDERRSASLISVPVLPRQWEHRSCT